MPPDVAATLRFHVDADGRVMPDVIAAAAAAATPYAFAAFAIDCHAFRHYAVI